MKAHDAERTGTLAPHQERAQENKAIEKRARAHAPEEAAGTGHHDQAAARGLRSSSLPKGNRPGVLAAKGGCRNRGHEEFLPRRWMRPGLGNSGGRSDCRSGCIHRQSAHSKEMGQVIKAVQGKLQAAGPARRRPDGERDGEKGTGWLVAQLYLARIAPAPGLKAPFFDSFFRGLKAPCSSAKNDLQLLILRPRRLRWPSCTGLKPVPFPSLERPYTGCGRFHSRSCSRMLALR